MGRKRKSIEGHAGAPTGGKKRSTAAVTPTPTTEITDETPPYSELDEPQVEGYIKVELDPDLDPGPDITRQVSICQSSNPVLVSDPDIDIGDVDVKVLRFPEDEEPEMSQNPNYGDLETCATSSESSEGERKNGKRNMSAGTQNENFGKQRLHGTGSERGAQILPDTEAPTPTSDPKTQQKQLEGLKKQIKNEDRKIEGLLLKIDEKKEEAATLRTMTAPFKTRAKDSLLHLAVSQHDEKAILNLIENGSDVNVRNSNGETPLHKVVSSYNGNSSLRIIKILIEKGSDLTIKSKKRADGSNSDMFLNLLFDADVPLGPSQFHDLVEFLLRRNLSELFNAPSSAYSKPTPLQLAVLKLDVKPETLKMLHEHGVNFKAILKYAMEGHRSSTFMASLVKFGADYRSVDRWDDSVLFNVVVWDDIDALKYFLTLDLDINATNSDGDTPLHFAMKSKSKNVLQIAQLLILKKANLKAINNKLQTPLHAAARSVKIGCSDVIRLLVDGGAAAFAKDKKNCTFLHYLMLNDTLTPSDFHKMVEYLLEKEYTKMFDQVNKDGLTPLHLALQNINMEVSTLSILRKQGGLELKMLPESIITDWLNRIAMGGNVKALRFLLTELDLDVSFHQKFWKNTPLHQVVLYGSRNVMHEVAILIKEQKDGQAIADFKNKGRRTPLDIAMERENMMNKEEVIDLLRNGIHSKFISCADENCGNGQPPQLGNDPQLQPTPITTNSVTFADSTSLDIENENSPTHHDDCEGSSLTDTPDAVKIHEDVLKKKAAEANTLKNALTSLKKEIGRLITLPTSWDTELNLAVTQGDEEAVMDLVQSGANVNGRDDKGNTPLYNAVARCTKKTTSLKITKFLIENGADVYALNQLGCPFFHPGMSTDYFHELALILAVRNADGVFNSLALPSRKYCDSARITGFQEIMRMVEVNEATLSLLRNVDLNAVDEDKLERSVLWYAVTGGRSLAMIKNLVKFGANPMYLTKWNETLVFGAAEAGRIDLFQYFLSLGMDINTVNKCGNTPLHYVMKSEEGNQLELTQFLIRNGANPNLKNNYWETPLHFAAAKIENNDTSISVIKELLDNGAFPFGVDKKQYSFLQYLIDNSMNWIPPLTSSQFHDVVQHIIAKWYTTMFQHVKSLIWDALNTVTDHAFVLLKYDTLSLLRENGLLPGVKIRSLIDSAAYSGNAKRLEILIKFRRDINNDDGGGRTVLQEVDDSIKSRKRCAWGRKMRPWKYYSNPTNRMLHRHECCGWKCQWPSIHKYCG